VKQIQSAARMGVSIFAVTKILRLYHPQTPQYEDDVSCLSVHCAGDPKDVHSFPTRRSSDLMSPSASRRAAISCSGAPAMPAWLRSEEHTSDLQSRENLVCRLLLEKKKGWKRQHEGGGDACGISTRTRSQRGRQLISGLGGGW